MQLILDTSVAHEVMVTLTDHGQTIQSVKRENQFGSQVTVPLIAELVDANGTLAAVDQVMVVAGAGSYTGVRVGVAIANAIGYLRHIPINNQPDGVLATPTYT